MKEIANIGKCSKYSIGQRLVEDDKKELITETKIKPVTEWKYPDYNVYSIKSLRNDIYEFKT